MLVSTLSIDRYQRQWSQYISRFELVKFTILVWWATFAYPIALSRQSIWQKNSGEPQHLFYKVC